VIAKLKGVLESYGTDWVVIDVNGVGYLVTCSRQTLTHLPFLGDPLSLYTETYMKNEQLHLCGFRDTGERSAFRLLTTVQGVGARVAMAILSVLTADQLNQAIYTQDKEALGRADGVGPKLAARILMELKDKVSPDALSLGTEKVLPLSSSGKGSGGLQLEDDGTSALVNLGYRPPEARQIIRQLLHGNMELTLDQLIRLGLQELTSGKRRAGDMA
jgi:Holliday junction DNA helicase RuvA